MLLPIEGKRDAEKEKEAAKPEGNARGKTNPLVVPLGFLPGEHGHRQDDAFSEDTIVLHFGGPAGTIDAYPLANTLIGFADTAYAINDTLDPRTEIEIIVEATGPGSYRAVIRRLKKGLAGGVLSGIAATIFWNVVSNVIYDATS